MLRSICIASTGLLLLSALVIPAQASAVDPSALPLAENYFPTLKPIIEAAVKESPRMVMRNLENAIAEQNRIAARAGQLPSVGGYMQYNPWQLDHRADAPGWRDTQKLYYNASINQPVFHWGTLENNTRIAELQKKITEGQTSEAYRGLVQEIRAQFMQMVLKKLQLARNEMAIQIARDQLAIAQTKLEKKVIAPGDMFMPRLNFDQAQLSADRAREDLDNAKRAFAKLTGTDPLQDGQIPDMLPTVTPAPELLGGILAGHVANQDLNSYYLETLRRQIEVEKLNYKNANVRLRPNFNLQAGVSQDEQSYTANIAQKYLLQSRYVGVQVNWSIFDGFSARAAKANASTRRRQAEINYDEARATLSEQTRAQLKQLEFSSRSMELANRILESNQGNVAGRKDDLSRGLVSEAEVNAAKLGLVDAQINASTSRFDYLMKAGDFLSMMLEDPALQNLPKSSL